MKASFLYLLLGTSSFMLAQNAVPPSFSFHPITIPKTECISAEQRLIVLKEIEENKQILQQLKSTTSQTSTALNPLFILPIRPKAGLEDYGYYSLFNQVDHHLTPGGNLTDYNCGERTYDWANGNHSGTDYVVWPYPWKKMDEEVMEIIAAAPGTILVKRDGYFDKNCTNSGNPNWNGIILEHADGSETWYWHFKDGSVTTKEVGDSVLEGEYLGLAGSSGSSDIPHVHFEVRDVTGAVIDPYAGACNDMNATSWWQEQPDYFMPEILTLSTHNSEAFDTDCGVVEDTYEALDFLPGDEVRFRIFYRDLQTEDRTAIVVEKPDGTILYDYYWDSTWPDYTAAWAEWIFPMDQTAMDGEYTITATFNGNVYETIFGVNTNLSVEDLSATAFIVYPNPTSEVLHVQGDKQIDALIVYDLLGKVVLASAPKVNKTEVDLSGLHASVYFVSVTSEGKRTVQRIVKE